MTAKLIFADIDDLFKGEAVTPALRQAIRQQIIKGNIFIPVSRQLPKGIMNAIQSILKTCPLIAYNGALALDEMGRPVVSQYLTAKLTANLCQLAAQENLTWNVYSGYVWYCAQKNDAVKQAEKMTQVQATVTSLAKIKQLRGIHLLKLTGPAATITKVETNLRQYSQLQFNVESGQILITRKGVSQATGIRELAAEFKLPLKDCWVLGKNPTDQAMLQIAGHSLLTKDLAEMAQKLNTIN